MKERPILFSAPMVRAILDGRKTQTRRVVKQTPHKPPAHIRVNHCACIEWVDDNGVTYTGGKPCPYGVVGDRLWVKETFRVVGWDESGDVTVSYLADGTTRVVKALVDDFDVWVERQSSRMIRAGARMMQHDLDGNTVLADGGRDECWIEMPEGVRPPLSSSLHMPRWASRITLTITDIRVQRLQDISEEDAKAEGVKPKTWGADAYAGFGAMSAFADLWDSINGEGAWDRNPWVWALTFGVVR